jgi:hypothetical protein
MGAATAPGNSAILYGPPAIAYWFPLRNPARPVWPAIFGCLWRSASPATAVMSAFKPLLPCAAHAATQMTPSGPGLLSHVAAQHSPAAECDILTPTSP